MPIRFKCPVCGYRIKAPDGSYGRRGACPRCKLMIRLPGEEQVERHEPGKSRPEPSEDSAAGMENHPDLRREQEDSALELD